MAGGSKIPTPMKKLLKLPFIFLANPKLALQRKEYIFVISHMRSFSTVLSHILGSNKEISGYAEMHLSYSGLADLLKLRRRVYKANGGLPEGRYVLDKILHNGCRISKNILARKNFRSIFLLRKPEDSIKSIINMGESLVDDAEWCKDPLKVLDYYRKRLRQIEEYAPRIDNTNGIFLQAERLIDDTEAVLGSLTGWLRLEEKLTPEYKLFKYTGKPGFGDPSSFIRTGRLVKGDRGDTRVRAQIPPEVLSQAREAYAACRETLSGRFESF